MWLSVHFRKIQSIFVTVYCMNFIIISCHTYRLFSLTFVPLPLAPNSGDATAKKPRVKLRRMSVVCAGSSTADDPINHTIVTVSKSTDSRTEYILQSSDCFLSQQLRLSISRLTYCSVGYCPAAMLM